MEKYELVMLINRLVKLSNKKDIQLAIKAVCETEMAGALFPDGDQGIKDTFKKLMRRT